MKKENFDLMIDNSTSWKSWILISWNSTSWPPVSYIKVINYCIISSKQEKAKPVKIKPERRYEKSCDFFFKATTKTCYNHLEFWTDFHSFISHWKWKPKNCCDGLSWKYSKRGTGCGVYLNFVGKQCFCVQD